MGTYLKQAMLKYGIPDRSAELEEEQRKLQQAQTWDATMASRASRKVMGGVDPALSKLPTNPKITLDEFAAKANPDFLPNHPTIKKAMALPGYGLQTVADLFPQKAQNWANRAGQSGGEVMTLADNHNKDSTGSTAGDLTADLFGGLMGFASGGSPGGVQSAGANLWKLGEEASGKILGKVAPKLPGLAQSSAKIAGATLPYEVVNAANNDREFSAEEGLKAAGSNVALGLLTHGLAKLPTKLKTKEGKLPEVKPEETFDNLFAETKPNADLLGNMRNEYKGLQMPRTQAEKELPFNPLLSQMRNTLEGKSNTPVKPLPRPTSPSRNIDPASLHDEYPLPDVSNLEGRALVNRAKTQTPALPGGRPLALPSPSKPNWEIGTGKIDPEYQVQQLAKMQKNAVNKIQAEELGLPPEQAVSFKRSPQTPEVEELNKAMGNRIGASKVEHAPEAMERPDMQAADTIAKLLGADGVTPVRNTSNQGIAMGRRVFLNEKNRDPVMYLVKHEAYHTIEDTNPELYAELVNDVRSFATDESSIVKHYTDQGYKPDDVWSEFHSDIMSELGDRPDFWAKMRETSPQVVQKVIDVLDSLIAKFKQVVGTDQSMTKYIRDIEALRDVVAPKVGKHLENVQGGNLQATGEGIAAKQNMAFKLGEQGKSRIEEIKDMVIAGARGINKTVNYAEWKEQMLKQFPQVANESQADKVLQLVYSHAGQLQKGEVTIKLQGQEVKLGKADLKQAGKLPGIKTNSTTGQTGGNLNDWNHIASKTDKVKLTAKGVADTIYNKGFDDLSRLKQVDKDAYTLALNSRESGGIAQHNLLSKMTDAQGNVIGESLKSIAKLIPKKAVQDFENYLVYRHAPSWLEQGRKVFPESEGVTADVARQRAAQYEQAHPEFKELGNRIVKWQRDFGKAWLVDTGIVKPETWNKLQEMYPDYVPFQRLMKETEIAGPGSAKRSFGNQANPLKKAEGSQREIISPLESIIEHTEKYVKVAKRNEVMQTLYGKIQQDPEAYKGLIEIMPEKGETFESVFAKDGMDGFIKFMEEPFEQAKARKGVHYDSPEVVKGIVNGETVHFKVQDPQLLEALTNLSPQGQNAVIEGARQITRMMKVLTTGSNPLFATRNIARDLPMAYVNSETLSNVPGVREVQFAWGILDSFARIVTGGKIDPGGYYKSFKAMGGGSHSSSMAADRNLLAESKAGVLPGYYSINKPITSLGRGLKTAGRGIEKITNAVETLPRLPEFVRTAKRGGGSYESKVKGLYNAQDVTVNFSKHGEVAKSADAFIPYLNAALQGIDKLGRTYTQNPVLAAYRSVVAITVPSIYLWIKNKDNPNYKNLSSWTKDNYYCIPTPGGKFLKIAKPREAGVVFGSLVERCLNKWAKDDPNGFKGFAAAWINSFAPPTRWIGAPLTDLKSNTNFAGSPIVPGYMEKLSPELQYDETTSAPAKKIGELFNASPKKIDYLARSYTGVLGELGIPAASEGRGESVGQRVGNVLNKTFFADPLYSSDTLSTFYDLKDKYDTANSDFKATKVKGPDYNPGKAKIMSSVSDKISDINKQVRKINADPNLSYQEKDRQVRALKQKSLDLANQALSKVQ